MKKLGDVFGTRRKRLLTAAGLLAIAVPTVFILASAKQSRAQSHSGDKLSFDVASVKEWQPKQPLPPIRRRSAQWYHSSANSL